jgi:uroporphyrinogen III methyltransferase/synthase
MTTKDRGCVFLVGAGPGDPGLITVKGLEVLRRAEVVVYDYLANAELLKEARPDAELIYVGKQAGQHTLSQEEINRLLVEKAQVGKTVARLKGGDPFVFGRGGEETMALAAAGVPFEVIPGVTSAVAAPAYAGIPVTQRGLASSFAVVTGHEDPTKAESAIDWHHLARGVDTLLFLMGVGNLPEIVARLVEHGRAPETPAALVRWGTTPRQETVVGTLADIAEKVKAAGLRPPAVAVFGQVVNLREHLRWYDHKPLFGKRVLVTRSREQASVLSQRLRELGAEPVELPAIAFEPPEDYSPLDAAIRHIHQYDWIIFTSTNGVRAFMERLWTLGWDARSLARVRLAAIGPATATALEQCRLRADYVPDQYVAEAVAAGLDDVRGQRILLPRTDIARPALAIALREAGATVDEVTAYRTVLAEGVQGSTSARGLVSPTSEDVRQMLVENQIDVVTFTSSSTVRNLVALLGDVEPLRGALIACIGPITAGTACEMGLRVDVIAEEYTIDGLIEVLIRESGALGGEPS